jgi:hypothetical protein
LALRWAAELEWVSVALSMVATRRRRSRKARTARAEGTADRVDTAGKADTADNHRQTVEADKAAGEDKAAAVDNRGMRQQTSESPHNKLNRVWARTPTASIRVDRAAWVDFSCYSIECVLSERSVGPCRSAVNPANKGVRVLSCFLCRILSTQKLT